MVRLFLFSFRKYKIERELSSFECLKTIEGLMIVILSISLIGSLASLSMINSFMGYLSAITLVLWSIKDIIFGKKDEQNLFENKS